MDVLHLVSSGNGERLFIFLGPMGSGKTSILIKLTSINHYAGKSSLYISNVLDTRNDDDLKNKNIKNIGISTHNQNITDDNIENIRIKSFYKFDYKQIKKYDVILIDEGQFFDESIITFTNNALKMGKTVYISSLDGDSNKNKFGHVLDLIPKAYYVYKYRGLCQFCLEKGLLTEAPFTARLKTGENVMEVDGNLIDVGGTEEKYKATCYKHHKEYNVDQEM